jgi:Lysozyme like domain
MGKRTPGEVYAALVSVGWPPAQAITMTAIAGAESGWRDDAIGDRALQDATWGPSYGLFQIRTLKRDTGRGTVRDLTQLSGDIRAQARAAWEISRHGADFSPWTVYRTGRYRDFLGQARAGVGASALADDADDGGPFPTFGPGWLPWNWPSEAGNAAHAAVGRVLGGARSIALEAVVAVLGLALVGGGLAMAVNPRARAKIVDWARDGQS